MRFNTALGLQSGSRMAMGLIDATMLASGPVCGRTRRGVRPARRRRRRPVAIPSSQWQTDMASFSMKARSCRRFGRKPDRLGDGVLAVQAGDQGELVAADAEEFSAQRILDHVAGFAVEFAGREFADRRGA